MFHSKKKEEEEKNVTHPHIPPFTQNRKPEAFDLRLRGSRRGCFRALPGKAACAYLCGNAEGEGGE